MSSVLSTGKSVSKVGLASDDALWPEGKEEQGKRGRKTTDRRRCVGKMTKNWLQLSKVGAKKLSNDTTSQFVGKWLFFVASCSFVSSAILRKAESELSDEIYLYVKFV